MNSILKQNLVQRQLQLKVHNILANLPLLYNSKISTLKQKDTRLYTAQMKFIRRTAAYSLIGHRRNGDILEELKVDTDEN
jgi:hypothetical protein